MVDLGEEPESDELPAGGVRDGLRGETLEWGGEGRTGLGVMGSRGNPGVDL